MCDDQFRKQYAAEHDKALAELRSASAALNAKPTRTLRPRTLAESTPPDPYAQVTPREPADIKILRDGSGVPDSYGSALRARKVRR